MGKFSIGRENTESARQVDDAAIGDVVEEHAGSLRAHLTRLVNVRGGYRFGKGKIGILHEKAADQRHEQDANHAAGDHQSGGLPIGFAAREVGPRSSDHKRGNGEDGPGRHRFTDGTGSSRDVLLEQGTLEDAEDRHTNDGGGISGRDGLSGAQPQIRIGSAQDHAHDQADHHGPERELGHLGVGRDERFVLLDRCHWSLAFTRSLSAFPSTVLPVSLA